MPEVIRPVSLSESGHHESSGLDTTAPAEVPGPYGWFPVTDHWATFGLRCTSRTASARSRDSRMM